MQTPMIISGGEDNEDEYTPDEIMQLVESSSPTTNVYDGTNFSGEESFRVRFTDDPYAVPVVVQSSTGYITINVNEESCGPSFSDRNASAMASVDASGLFGCCLGSNGAWSTDVVGSKKMESRLVRLVCEIPLGSPPPHSSNTTIRFGGLSHERDSLSKLGLSPPPIVFMSTANGSFPAGQWLLLDHE
ncbi:hypothetical protein Bca4012_045022 [Brassica carinata]